mgnify:CR=1 FL=1
MNKEPYSSLYKILGFYPDNIHLYEQAFLHKSSSVESGDGRWLNNERLEFLGDAVLDAVVADIVYKHFQNKREGFLTNTRSKIVQRETMNRVAVELGLDKMVVYSAKLSSHNNHMYGNALEALIGAIYLDGGFEPAKAFIHRFILTDIEHKKLFYDSKTILQEVVQGHYEEPLHYELIGEEGPDHDKRFLVEAVIGNTTIGEGSGHTKKAAEQEAAYQALLWMKERGLYVS